MAKFYSCEPRLFTFHFLSQFEAGSITKISVRLKLIELINLTKTKILCYRKIYKYIKKSTKPSGSPFLLFKEFHSSRDKYLNLTCAISSSR